MNPSDEPAPGGRPRRAGAPALAASIGVIVVVALLLAYAQRRALAREALVGWLESRGVAAKLEVDEFGLARFRGRVRAGPAGDPDFTAENVDVSYSVQGFWSNQPLGLRVRSVRLTRPVLKARWRDGKLSLGALDPIIEEFRRRPPRPDARQPAIIVQDGLARLDTPYGPVRLRVDATLDDGKLLRFNGRLDPAVLRGPGLDAATGAGGLGLVTHGDRVDLALDLPIARLRAGTARLENARVRLAGQAPYPDLKRRRGDGQAALRLILDAGVAASGENVLRAAGLVATFHGASTGWVDSLALRGDVTVGGRAASTELGGATTGPARLAATGRNFAWTRTGGDAVSTPLKATVSVEGLAGGDLRFERLAARADGDGRWDRRGFALRLDGSASGRGGYAGFGPARPDDLAELADLKRAARDFTVNAGDIRADFGPGGLALALDAPVSLRPRTGGEVIVQPLGATPLLSQGVGTFRLASFGDRLPQGTALVRRFALTPDGFTAAADLKVKTSLGVIRDADLAASGDLRLAGGGTSFRTDGCAQVKVARLDLDQNDALDIQTLLCQGAAPLFTFAEGRWRVRGQAREASALVPFLQARVSAAAGVVDFGGGPAGLDAVARITAAQVADVAAPTRFNPLRVAGQASLKAQVWTGRFVASDLAGRPLGTATLRHDIGSGRGGVQMDSGQLVFAEGGLQPAELSPLAAAIGSPAAGQARFTGVFDWTPAGATSSGRLVVAALRFQSPAGPVQGLSGDIALASLAPLRADPGQSLRAERIAAFAPLIGSHLTFGLADQVLKVVTAEAAVGGGRVWLEPFDLPFNEAPAWNGVLNIENVQVQDIIKASPFGDRMDLRAKVSGRVPFAVSPAGLRISGGELHAVEPGRLSIRRDALGGVAATGAEVEVEAPGAPAVATSETPTAFADFAYQAMENLAFDQLSAGINSLPEGRLGVLLRIKGEHSPPQHQEIRVGLAELLDRSFLNRPMLLPSGVKVDLTLDTSLNLDQLLEDYGGYRELRHSDPVQGAGPTTGDDKLPKRTR